MSTQTRADKWAYALEQMAEYVKAVEEEGGTVTEVDIGFVPGRSRPTIDVSFIPVPGLERLPQTAAYRTAARAMTDAVFKVAA